MYYVYILKSLSQSDRIYVGYTTNLKQRMERHNSGDCISTSKLRPWKLETYFAFRDMNKAKSFEEYLKSHSGRIFTQKRLL